jgi:peptide/nickel transport system substrate-binding protein
MGRRIPASPALMPALLAALVLVATGCDSSTPTPSGSGTAQGTSGPVLPSSGSPGPEPGSLAPSSPATDLAGSTYQPEPATAGGTAVIGAVEEANVFHPFFVEDPSDRAVAAAAWSGLVTLGPDGRYLPGLAASIPTTTNGGVAVPGAGGDAMTVTWRLRDGLAWSDGEPLTCDDVRYTWQWVLDPGNVGVDPSGFEDLDDVECRSATDMVWHFSKVYEAYLTFLPTPLPKHFLEAIPIADQTDGAGFRSADLAKLPVDGPFRFVSAVPGGDLKMAVNPHALSPATGGPAPLGSLTWHWYANAASLVAAFKAGALDAAIGLDPLALPTAGGLRGGALSAPSLSVEMLLPNWATGEPPRPGSGRDTTRGCSRSVLVAGRGAGCPMADPAIRGAIAATLDRAAIAEGPYAGTAAPAGTMVPDGIWFGSGGPAPAPNLARARTLLEAAGWTLGPDGVRTRDGLAARIEICTLAEPTRVAAANLIAEELAGVGIRAEVSPVDAVTLGADVGGVAGPCSLPAANFDAALLPVPSPVDPLGYYFLDHSSQITPNGANLGSVADPAIDAALEGLTETADPDAIRTAIGAYERAAAASVAAVPIVRPDTAALVKPTLGNVLLNPFQPVATWNIGDWFRRS